ncbi:hypothetical protein M9H77_29070 [Catharanthus roseus]|uniref:Uncharacterized protein n=1 Tax=Catharanthus roseus TaxID=4058 RepID=A0ACC0AIK2_CATRO|nr:hypothetical protein M9H77_29070 [Catharanthus roseus]
MPYLQPLKIQKESYAVSSTISCYLNPSGHRKITRLTIFAVSDPSSSSSSSSSKNNSPAAYSKQFLTENSSKSGKSSYGAFFVQKESTYTHDGDVNKTNGKETSKGPITIMAKRFSAKRRPFWRKLLFGSKKFRSIILLNIVTIVYASNILVVKEAETMMDPAAFSAVRFIVSAIPFLPFVFEARHDVETRKSGMELGLWISLGYLIEALGLLTAEAGRASFISLFTVLVVPFLESILGTIVPARTWFGVLMSVIGVAMLECSGSPPNVGDLLNFLSAIFFGIHTLRTEHISRTTKKENFMALLGYEVCVIAVLSTLWYIVGGTCDLIQESESVPWTWPLIWDWMVGFPWIPALYTGVFSTGLCLWAEIAAMRDVSATETAVIYGLEPIWGAGFAWFLLGERWGMMGWIGAALILGGSLTVQIYETFADKSRKNGKIDNTTNLLMLSSNQKQGKKLSGSPVVVISKNQMDIFKK